jgi:YfiH family protein
VNNWQRAVTGGVEHFLLQPAAGVQLVFVGRHSGASTAAFSSLNCSFAVGDDPRAVARNRDLIGRALVLPALSTVRQVHSDRVVQAESLTAGAESIEADAIVARRPSALGIKVADCLPVYIFALDGTAVAVAHCGWRGTVARLAQKAAQALARAANTPPRSLGFCLGPCICGGCYEVGDDVRGAFADQRGALAPAARSGRWLLDLRLANRAQLVAIGLSELPGLEICSLESTESCYSARRDRVTGRNLALAVLGPRLW